MSALDEWPDVDDGGYDHDPAPPRRPITAEASAGFYARKGQLLGEDPPDGCLWCGDGSAWNGHRGCPNAPMTAEQEAAWWAAQAWQAAEPVAS